MLNFWCLAGAAAAPLEAENQGAGFSTNTIVGDGTPASCTRGALAAALAVGGSLTIVFNCGDVHTILFDSAITLPAGSSMVIDGAGQVTLDGSSCFRCGAVTNFGSLEVPGTT